MREQNIFLYSTRITLLLTVFIFTETSPVIIYIIDFNPQETKALFCVFNTCYFIINKSMLVGSSETVRVLSTNQSSKEIQDLKILQWIAGVIDGDGYFGVSKNKYCSLEIVIETRDVACLYKIKNKYGGSVKPSSSLKAVRYRLHHLEGIKTVINDINGLLLNPVRIIQFKKICSIYNIPYVVTPSLNYNSGYLSGLFDSDGSIYLNIISQQVFITISQKNRELLDTICAVYGGKVYSANKDNTAFKWTVSRKSEVLNILDKYFHWNNCVSAKNKRFGIVKQFYLLSSIGATKSTFDSPLGKKIILFKERWDSYDIINNSSMID